MTLAPLDAGLNLDHKG